MASRHQLALDVIDTTSPYVLKLSDVSVYAANLPVECARLEIYPPGFLSPKIVEVQVLRPHFTTAFTARELGLQTQIDTNALALPDGVWKLGYSVSPADYTRVEYYHLRVTGLLNRYAQVLCRVQLQRCELSADQHKRLNRLHEIHGYILAAKAATEECGSPLRGMELYTYAEQLLSKFSKSDCPTCY